MLCFKSISALRQAVDSLQHVRTIPKSSVLRDLVQPLADFHLDSKFSLGFCPPENLCVSYPKALAFQK